jgi:hypothetical protein
MSSFNKVSEMCEAHAEVRFSPQLGRVNTTETKYFPDKFKKKVAHNFTKKKIGTAYSDWLRAGRSGDRIPLVGEIFRTRPDRPWGPPSLVYNGYLVSFPGLKRPGRGVDHPPHLAPRYRSLSAQRLSERTVAP